MNRIGFTVLFLNFSFFSIVTVSVAVFCVPRSLLYSYILSKEGNILETQIISTYLATAKRNLGLDQVTRYRITVGTTSNFAFSRLI